MIGWTELPAMLVAPTTVGVKPPIVIPLMQADATMVVPEA